MGAGPVDAERRAAQPGIRRLGKAAAAVAGVCRPGSQGRHGQGGFFQGRWHGLGAAPAAVGILRRRAGIPRRGQPAGHRGSRHFQRPQHPRRAEDGVGLPGSAWFPNHSGIQEPSACCTRRDSAVRGGSPAAAGAAVGRRARRERSPARRARSDPARCGRKAVFPSRGRKSASRRRGSASPAATARRRRCRRDVPTPSERGSPRRCRPRRARRRPDASMPSRRAPHAYRDAALWYCRAAIHRAVRRPIDPRQFAGRGQRRHGGRGQPHRQIRVDRPAPVGTLRLAKEPQTFGRHGLVAAEQRDRAPWPRNWSTAWPPGIRRDRVGSAGVSSARAA